MTWINTVWSATESENHRTILCHWTGQQYSDDGLDANDYRILLHVSVYPQAFLKMWVTYKLMASALHCETLGNINTTITTKYNDEKMKTTKMTKRMRC